MSFGFIFFLNSIALGVGLAMDAFSVSLANGLHEPEMRRGRMCGVAGTYAGFQFLMPMLGWILVRTLASYFEAFRRAVPWIALALLLYIGGKMLLEGIKERRAEKECAACAKAECGECDGPKSPSHEGKQLSFALLMLQGLATSIDALSVGFTIAEYGTAQALVCGALIAAVTFGICYEGLLIGKRVGTRLAGRASILGGGILIVIGIEIFVRSMVG